jgi:Pentapeptide repeats (8 copies)
MACNLTDKDFTNACLQRANLIGANLTGAILIGADLSEAYLEEACLVRADLAGANLRGAILSKANLDDAYFFGTTLRGATLYRARMIAARLHKVDLRETNLQDADLVGSTDLLGTEFAGANVARAKLPEPVMKFEGLAHVNDTAKMAQPLLLAMLLACFYAWLTIATTTDVALLTNAASSPLPLLGVAIPLVGLYWTVPFLLLCFYIYFLYEFQLKIMHIVAILHDLSDEPDLEDRLCAQPYRR